MSRNWALIVGINQYDHHPDQDLRFAVRDAERMRDFLVSKANFPENQVICCLGDGGDRNDRTYPSCDNLLRWLERELHPSRIGPIDRFWFYFSGHGVSQNGRDYLLAANTLQEDLQRFALPLDEVTAALRRHTQADIVLVLDACREQIGSKSAGNKIGEQTQQLAQERGITTIFSCDYGQYSYELAELQHGAFTYALVDALQQHTLPIPLEQQLQRRVRELHQQANRPITQTPKIRLDSATKALHPLLPDCATAADVDLLTRQATEAELEEKLEKAKDLWWQVVEVSPSRNQIAEARRAMERIDQKISRLQPPVVQPANFAQPFSSGLPPVSSPPTVAPPTPTASIFEFDVVTITGIEKTGLLGTGAPKVLTHRHRSKAEYRVEDLGNGVTLEMVAIPGGTFLMGAPKLEKESFDDERPQHQVSVAPFWMGKFAVTQAQWRRVAALPKVERGLQADPSRFKGENRPVEKVSWLDAVEFCARLSKATGKPYRLPSEAEWEYACRAGTATPFHFGETIATDLANYNGNGTYGAAPKGQYREQTTNVGSFPPNAFGLHDMHGNVWEWCADHWHGNYEGAPTYGSAWLSGDEGANRLIRGGSWDSVPRNCRSAFRLCRSPDFGHYFLGFRVVCSAPRTS